MIKAIKKVLRWPISKFLLNYEKPRYFKHLYMFAESYAQFYRGDNNRDRRTNGGWKFLEAYVLGAKPKVIFDVGAQMGTYTMKINDIDSSVKIFAFEPARKTYEELVQNVKDRESIHPVNLALSSAEGELTLYTNSELNAINSLYKIESQRFSHDSSEIVNVSTVDSFSAKNDVERIDMLKIDTEGNDLEVIKGAQKMLESGKVGIIQFEFSILNTYSHTYIYDFYQYLKKFGYEIYKIKPLGIEKVTIPENERSVYSYFVAIKPEDSKLIRSLSRY